MPDLFNSLVLIDGHARPRVTLSLRRPSQEPSVNVGCVAGSRSPPFSSRESRVGSRESGTGTGTFTGAAVMRHTALGPGGASDARVALVAVTADVLKQCFQGIDAHFESGLEVGLSDALT